MKGRIVIELHDEAGEYGVNVAVSGDLNTLEVAGLLDAAKAQHLASKQSMGPTIYQSEPETPMATDWSAPTEGRAHHLRDQAAATRRRFYGHKPG